MIDRRELLGASALALSSLAAMRGQPAMASLGKGSGIDPMLAPSRSAQGWTIPRPMYWSFDARDPVVEVADLRLSFRVATIGPDENSYLLRDPKVTAVGEDRWTVTADSLAWPGGRELAPGRFRADIVRERGVVTITPSAEAPGVRAIKMVVHGLPRGRFFHTGWQVVENGLPVPAEGITSNYPVYTGNMPVWFVGEERGVAFASLDTTPAPRRCAARLRDGAVEVELIAEQDARRLGDRYAAPPWRITRNTTLSAAIDARIAELERGAGLKSWEARADMPAWARNIDLVVTLHGMHWSGYVFNDYAAMGRAVEWVTRRIDGSRVLFFLAGWDGRYYRQYGASRAEPKMGGEDGLDRLVRRIHAKGAHVMAMFVGNAVNEHLPGFEQWGRPSGYDALPGAFDWSPMSGYQVDWAEIRAGITGAHWLNLGAPAWREHLTRQIASLNDRFGFDGTFIDTQPILGNDRRHEPLEGLRRLCDDLRARRPNLLIAAETWFDLSLAFMPMSQTPDGPYGWSDRFQRRFAHLSLAEPSRGSTGVHELGHVPYDFADLQRSFSLPSLGFVEDTYQAAPAAVERVIAAARARGT